MGMDRKRIEKMLAVAISPGAYEEEAISALRKAREVVKKKIHYLRTRRRRRPLLFLHQITQFNIGPLTSVPFG
jgi:hypothetical protein